MKVDTRYGSIWDELPDKTERKIPETQQEARDFYEAAESSMHKSLMQTWDSHNETVKKTAELRRIYERKEFLERRELEHKEEIHERDEEAALKNLERQKEFVNQNKNPQ